MQWPYELCTERPEDVRTRDDPERQPTLSGDRIGFKVTRENCERNTNTTPRLNVQLYNDFDVCYTFPKSIKNPNKEISGADVHKMLLSYCRARVGKSVEELNTVEKFHPVYGLSKTHRKSMSREQFANLVKKLIFRIFEHIGALFVIEEGYDKNGHTFVRVRLTEKGCGVIADYKNYPLQVARECTRYRQFRDDPEFIPPYVPYQGTIESRPLSPDSPGPRTVFERYDRLSNPVKMSQIEPMECSLFRDVDRIRLLRMAVFEFINIDLLIRDGWILDSFALKQPAREKALRKNWANLGLILSTSQPLDDIRNYFGEEVAMYYAWLGYYTKCLGVPALFGLVVGGIGLVYNRQLSFDNPIVNVSRLIYTVFIGIWSTVFFSLWTRKEKLLSLKWGVETAEVAKVSHEENPTFKPSEYRSDPVHPDKFIRWFSPAQHRARRWFTACLLVVMCFCVTLVLNDDLLDMLAQLLGKAEGYTGIEDWIRILSPSDTIAAHAAHVVMATSLLMKLYDNIFRSNIAWRLGEFENHQHIQGFSDSTSFKLFFFKICGYFTVLFYLAFFKEYFNPCDDTSNGRCLPRLAKQLVVFYVMDLVMIASEMGTPLGKYVVAKVMAKPQPNMPLYQYQAYLSSYSKNAGLTGEYLEKIIQFGYTVMFSMACPFLPFFGYVVNTIELRTDAYKLTTVYKRPFPRHADGLGIWDDLQKAMTFFGILSNVLLCTFATVGHEHTLTTKLVASLVLLLLALGLKDFVEYKLPSESAEYELMKARMQVVDYEAMWGHKQ